MRRLAMTIPLESVPLAEQADFVRELDAISATPTSGRARRRTSTASCRSRSRRSGRPTLRLGFAFLPVQTRGPAVLAMSAAALAEAAPGRS